MSCNKAYLEEVEIAFARATEVKTEVETLIQQFVANKNRVNEKAAAVIDWAQEFFQVNFIEGNLQLPYDERPECYTGLVNGIKRQREDADYDPDMARFNLENRENFEEFDVHEVIIETRKRYIKDCAVYIQDVEKFKEDFLRKFETAQTEDQKVLRSATKATTRRNTQRKANTSFFDKVKSVVSGLYQKVKVTVSNAIQNIKDIANAAIQNIRTMIGLN